MTVAEVERWLAPILNYIPAQASDQARSAREAVLASNPSSSVPANDIASKDLASHPPGCACAVHLAWRKKAARG